MNWSSCSPDILYLIFKKLDNKSLLICLSICQLWRDVAEQIIAQTKDLWQHLAENHIYNQAICCKQKSTLLWREICLNSMLWCNLNSVKIHLDKTWSLKRQNINDLHIFKDKIIVMYDTIAEYFHVETLSRIMKKPLLTDCQETEHISVKHIDGKVLCISFRHNSTEYSPKCHVYKLVDDRCFVIDNKHALWRFKCCGSEYGVRFLMRQYDAPGSICRMNVHKADIYLLMNNGRILHVSEWGLCFTTVAVFERFDFGKSPVLVMFLKHSIVVSVPRETGTETMKVSPIGNTGEVLIECPGLSCATPHGDLLLLGFEDGTVEIFYPQKLLNGYSPKLKFNIRDVLEYTLEDTAIAALEVHEVEYAHHLFVATHSYVFKMVLYQEE